MDTVEIKDEYVLNVDDESFVSVLVLDGNGTIGAGDTTLSIKSGESVFVPAGIGKVNFIGELKILISSL